MPDLADERADGVIEAYIGSPQRGHRRATNAIRSGTPDGSPLLALDNRIAWNEALQRESARHRRYRRPAAIVVVSAQPRARAGDTEGWLERLAGPIAHVLRRGARETDLVTRAAEGRFQVLLPETTGVEAQRFAARVLADCDVWVRAVGAPVDVRVSSAAASGEMDLEAALARAVAAIEPGAAGPVDPAIVADAGRPDADQPGPAPTRPARSETTPPGGIVSKAPRS